jgi:hypothetical protein
VATFVLLPKEVNASVSTSDIPVIDLEVSTTVLPN